MGKRTDEVSLKTYKILISLVSAASLTINLFKTDNLGTLFFISLSYFASNLLSFYAVNVKTEVMLNSREFVKRTLLYVIVALFLIVYLSSNIDADRFEKVSNALNVFTKVVSGLTSWFIFYVAVKNDLYDSPEPQEFAELRKSINEEMAEETDRELFKARDSRTENNSKRKKFVEENDRKLRTERGTKK